MKYLIVKDKKKRNLVIQNQVKKLYLKSLNLAHYSFKDLFSLKIKKPHFIFYFKYMNILKVFSLRKKGSKILVKNRCKLTGRAKSIVRFYKISRIVFRELSSFGFLLGVKKSSW
jgi:ribosomal protein S14